jgi:hypothetical protein
MLSIGLQKCEQKWGVVPKTPSSANGRLGTPAPAGKWGARVKSRPKPKGNVSFQDARFVSKS